jgi:hypothetical protein
MYDQELQLVTVSPLNDDGSSFTVSYLELPSASPLSTNFAVRTLQYMLPHDFRNPPQLISANRKIEVRKDFEGISNRLMFTS